MAARAGRRVRRATEYWSDARSPALRGGGRTVGVSARQRLPAGRSVVACHVRPDAMLRVVAQAMCTRPIGTHHVDVGEAAARRRPPVGDEAPARRPGRLRAVSVETPTGRAVDPRHVDRAARPRGERDPPPIGREVGVVAELQQRVIRRLSFPVEVMVTRSSLSTPKRAKAIRPRVDHVGALSLPRPGNAALAGAAAHTSASATNATKPLKRRSPITAGSQTLPRSHGRAQATSSGI